MRLAERNPDEAVLMLQPGSEILIQSDWPDLLASDLMSISDQRLGRWADAMGLAAATLSRGFRGVYGVTPAGFRAEVRARKAMEMIERTQVSLARSPSIAAIPTSHTSTARLSR